MYIDPRQKDLGLSKETFDYIFVSFAIMVMPNVLPRLVELLKPGGFLGITSWESLCFYPLVVKSLKYVTDKPTIPSHDEVSAKMFGEEKWGDEV